MHQKLKFDNSFEYNLRFKKMLLDFALSKVQAGKVKRVNDQNLHNNEFA